VKCEERVCETTFVCCRVHFKKKGVRGVFVPHGEGSAMYNEREAGAGFIPYELNADRCSLIGLDRNLIAGGGEGRAGAPRASARKSCDRNGARQPLGTHQVGALAIRPAAGAVAQHVTRTGFEAMVRLFKTGW
jgi:hypothetical protein